MIIIVEDRVRFLGFTVVKDRHFRKLNPEATRIEVELYNECRKEAAKMLIAVRVTAKDGETKSELWRHTKESKNTSSLIFESEIDNHDRGPASLVHTPAFAEPSVFGFQACAD